MARRRMWRGGRWCDTVGEGTEALFQSKASLRGLGLWYIVQHIPITHDEEGIGGIAFQQ
jgi:hypothetical protein